MQLFPILNNVIFPEISKTCKTKEFLNKTCMFCYPKTLFSFLSNPFQLHGKWTAPKHPISIWWFPILFFCFCFQWLPFRPSSKISRKHIPKPSNNYNCQTLHIFQFQLLDKTKRLNPHILSTCWMQLVGSKWSMEVFLWIFFCF